MVSNPFHKLISFPIIFLELSTVYPMFTGMNGDILQGVSIKIDTFIN